MGKLAAQNPSVSQGSKPPTRASLSHWTSLTKYKFKGKIINNFEGAEIETPLVHNHDAGPDDLVLVCFLGLSKLSAKM